MFGEFVETYKGFEIYYQQNHFFVVDIFLYNQRAHQHLFEYAFWKLSSARSAISNFIRKMS